MLRPKIGELLLERLALQTLSADSKSSRDCAVTEAARRLQVLDKANGLATMVSPTVSDRGSEAPTHREVVTTNGSAPPTEERDIGATMTNPADPAYPTHTHT